jgi:hypothetical protein
MRSSGTCRRVSSPRRGRPTGSDSQLREGRCRLDHTQDATRRGLLEIDLRPTSGVASGAGATAARSYLGHARMGVETGTHQRFRRW